MIEKAIISRASGEARFGNVDFTFGINNANQSIDGPTGRDYIVFYRLNTVPNSTKGFPGNTTGKSFLDTADVQFNCYSRTALGSANLAEYVRAVYDRLSGSFGGIEVQSMDLINMETLFEFNETVNTKGFYQVSLVFSCRFKPQYQ